MFCAAATRPDVGSLQFGAQTWIRSSMAKFVWTIAALRRQGCAECCSHCHSRGSSRLVGLSKLTQAQKMSEESSVTLSNGARISVRGYIGMGTQEYRGVPYVYYVSSDRAPLPLLLVFTVHAPEVADAVVVSSVAVTGQVNEQLVRNGPIEVSNGVVTRSGGVSVTRFGRSFSGSIEQPRACAVTFAGKVVFPRAQKSYAFSGSLIVPYQRKNSQCTGWGKLLIYDHL